MVEFAPRLNERSVSSAELAKFQAEADHVFPIWAGDHVAGPIGLFATEPGNEHQDISIVSFDAQPSLEHAKMIGFAGMGETYQKMVSQAQELGVVDLAKKRMASGQSTLVATLHLHNVIDAAASHNIMFVASEDPDFAQHNVLLANPMLAWTSIKGVETMQALRKSGRIVRGIPLDGAAKHGLSNELVDFVDRRAAPVIRQVLEEGNVFHRAPSGTRGKKIILADGTLAYSIRELNRGEVMTIRKRTNCAVGMPMNVNEEDSVGVVMPPVNIETDEDVHKFMVVMTQTLNELVEENLVYGMPEGATEVVA